MSKKLYLGLYVGPLAAMIVFLVLTLVAGAIGGALDKKDEIAPITGIFLVLTSISALAWIIIHTVYSLLILGKMWGSIQDGYTEISVGKAIGFLFIPFFNFYWVFKAWGGYPTEYNAFAARNNLQVQPLSSGVFIAFPIAMLLSVIYIGWLALPFVMIAVIIKVCDAVNALETAKGSPQGFYQPPPPPRQF